MKELIITENEAGQRFDKYLMKYLNKAPSSFTYKMLRKKNITLNGSKAAGAEKLKTGDVVKLFLSDETLEKFSEPVIRPITGKSLNTEKYNIKDNIIYEDDNVIFINKKSGILSQKAKPDDVSVNEYMIDYLLNSDSLKMEDLKTFKPSVCNRLDRNTSGLITGGKSLMGLQELSRLFKERGVDKYYITVTAGEVKKGSKIKGYLKKDEKTNKVKIISDTDIIKADKTENETAYNQIKADYEHIETEYEPLYTGKLKEHTYTVLKVKLITGKTHQIRAHLSSIGHPVLGDMKYGKDSENRFFKEAHGVKCQLLHSYELIFKDVKGGLSYLNGRTFKAALPDIYKRFLNNTDVI